MTNTVTDARLHSEVEIHLSKRASRIGFEVLERCCSWTEGRHPHPREPWYQLVLARRQLTIVAAHRPLDRGLGGEIKRDAERRR